MEEGRESLARELEQKSQAKGKGHARSIRDAKANMMKRFSNRKVVVQAPLLLSYRVFQTSRVSLLKLKFSCQPTVIHLNKIVIR